MSEQSVHQQKNNEEINQQIIFTKGEFYYEKINIRRQFCSDILRVRF